MTGLVLGGAGGTAYGSPPSHYGLATDPATLPRDETYLVGRTRADHLLNQPDITHGATATFELLFRPQGLPNYAARYRDLRDRADHANDAAIATGTTQDGTPWFAEQHRKDSLLVKCQPGRDLADAPAVWGLLVGRGDGSLHPDQFARLSIEVFVLADVDAYGSYNAVRADLER